MEKKTSVEGRNTSPASQVLNRGTLGILSAQTVRASCRHISLQKVTTPPLGFLNSSGLRCLRAVCECSFSRCLVYTVTLLVVFPPRGYRIKPTHNQKNDSNIFCSLHLMERAKAQSTRATALLAVAPCAAPVSTGGRRTEKARAAQCALGKCQVVHLEGHYQVPVSLPSALIKRC